MRQFLQKTLELIRRILAIAGMVVNQVAAFLRSVNIDPPRAVMLCVVFQLILLVALALAFRASLVGPIVPQGGSPSIEPPRLSEPAEDAFPGSPGPRAPSFPDPDSASPR